MSEFKAITHYEIVVKEITEACLHALDVSGNLIEGSAQLLCPVDLGQLRGSITHQLDQTNLEVRIGTNVEYAPYIEFGTGEFAENGQGRKGGWFFVSIRPQLSGWLRPLGKTKDGQYLYFTYGSKPQPFLRPALINNIENIKRIFKDVTK